MMARMEEVLRSLIMWVAIAVAARLFERLAMRYLQAKQQRDDARFWLAFQERESEWLAAANDAIEREAVRAYFDDLRTEIRHELELANTMTFREAWRRRRMRRRASRER